MYWPRVMGRVTMYMVHATHVTCYIGAQGWWGISMQIKIAFLATIAKKQVWLSVAFCLLPSL
jgi:hypothetical protein